MGQQLTMDIDALLGDVLQLAEQHDAELLAVLRLERRAALSRLDLAAERGPLTCAAHWTLSAWWHLGMGEAHQARLQLTWAQSELECWRRQHQRRPLTARRLLDLVVAWEDDKDTSLLDLADSHGLELEPNEQRQLQDYEELVRAADTARAERRRIERVEVELQRRVEALRAEGRSLDLAGGEILMRASRIYHALRDTLSPVTAPHADAVTSERSLNIPVAGDTP